MRARLLRLLWLLPTVLSIAYFAFWACAPAAYLDPPLSANGPRGIVGVAGVYSNEHVVEGQHSSEQPDGVDAQVWFQRRFNRLGFSLQLAAGQSAYITTGGTFRVHVLDRPRFRMATELMAGWMYAGVAVPLVTTLTPELEWYVSPWVTFRSGNVLRLPTGMRYAFDDGPVLSFEVGAATLRDTGGANPLELWGALGIGFPLWRI